MKLSLFCICGASGTGTITPDARAEKFRDAWLSAHSGDGHAPCDQKTASAARRKQERDEERKQALLDRCE